MFQLTFVAFELRFLEDPQLVEQSVSLLSLSTQQIVVCLSEIKIKPMLAINSSFLNFFKHQAQSC